MTATTAPAASRRARATSASTRTSSASAPPTSAPASRAAPAPPRCPLSQDRRDVPAPDHPLRPAGHEGRAAGSQGAVDLLPVRRVRRDLPHPGRPVRVHGGRPAATPSPATTGRSIARTMYTRPIVATVIAVLLAVFFALFMYSAHGPQGGESLAIFEFIPAELIHNTRHRGDDPRGARRARRRRDDGPARSARREGVGWRDVLGSRRGARPDRPGAVVRHRPRVARPGPVPRGVRRRRRRAAVPWYRRRWLVHALVVWGFLGLLAATGLDYGLALLGDQGDRDAGADLVPGPPPGHRRRRSPSSTAPPS